MSNGEQQPRADHNAVIRSARRQDLHTPSAREGFSQCKGQAARGHSEPGEEMAEKEQQRPKLPLKHSGELVDVRHALSVVEALRAKQRVFPDRFEALVAVAQGRPEEAGAKHLESLKQDRYLGPDGKVRPDIAAILASALETRDNTHVLVQPFRLTSEQEKLIADQALEQNARTLIDMVFPSRSGRGGPLRG
jgi:hypothetical protein